MWWVFCSSLTATSRHPATYPLTYPVMSRLHDALSARFTDLDEIKDVANHGCQGGVSGFIYYSENEQFFDQYEDEIYDYLNDCELSMMDFVQRGSTIRSLKNDMVWCVVELWCQAQELGADLEEAALAA